MFPLKKILAEQNFLYWVDISGTWAKTFFIPDLYGAQPHTQKSVKPLSLMCYLYLIWPLM